MSATPTSAEALARAEIPEEQARVDIYRLLALLLAGPPGADLLAAVRGIRSRGGELASVWQDLRQEAEMAEPLALEREYHDLFVGLGRGELNPYASWYLTGFLMEKPLADLRDELAGLGLARRVGVPEPEDHAAALCEAMAIMLADASRDDAVCERFFRSYLGSWMERFFEDLQGSNGARFYRAVGRLGRAFMEIEQQYYAMPA